MCVMTACVVKGCNRTEGLVRKLGPWKGVKLATEQVGVAWLGD